MQASTPVSFLRVEETEADLFTMSDEYSLAPCVSEDLGIGRGIALKFKAAFGSVDFLRRQGAKVGV